MLTRDARAFLHQALSTPCLDVVVAASGATVTDVTGRRILDFHGNNVHHVGHAHPRVVKAVRDQLEELTFSPRRYTNVRAVELAERLAELSPGDLCRSLFTPSGSDAVEVALRLARAATGRHKTVSLWGSYHGAGFGAASVGGEAMFRSSATGPLLPGGAHVPPPTCSRCPWRSAGPACCQVTATMIETALEYEGDVALVIATPVKPAEWIPPPGMWEAVRAACDRHGTLLIFDEVACGLGKTGRMFASEHEVVDVVPDILVTGKALGGGIVPLAAVTARDELDVGAEIAIGHYTHEKNPILAAAALATLDVLEDDHLVERAAELGHQALKLGAALVQRHALVTEVRGLGLTFGVELASSVAAEAVVYLGLERGLSFTRSERTLCLSPPLIVTPAQLELAFEILDDAIGEAETAAQSQAEGAPPG